MKNAPATRSTALLTDQLVLLVLMEKDMGTLKAVYVESSRPMTCTAAGEQCVRACGLHAPEQRYMPHQKLQQDYAACRVDQGKSKDATAPAHTHTHQAESRHCKLMQQCCQYQKAPGSLLQALKALRSQQQGPELIIISGLRALPLGSHHQGSDSGS